MFILIVTLTLAFGIGVNSTVLGVIDSMFVRKLPVPEPQRIVGIYSADRRAPSNRVSPNDLSSAPLFRDVRTALGDVANVAAYAMADIPIENVFDGAPTRSAFISGNYFDALSVRPQLGRFINTDEEEPEGSHAVVVISDVLWHSSFGGDRGVLGRQIQIRKTAFTIVGVAPNGFTGLHPEGRTDLWLPYTMRREALGLSDYGNRGSRQTQIFARLTPSSSLRQLQTRLLNLSRELRAANPTEYASLELRAAERDRLTSYGLSPTALEMFAIVWVMVALLHLVACSNVASLMYARLIAGRRETAVRLCLGATRSRIVTQSLTDACLVTIPGALGGLALGHVLTGFLAQMQFLSTLSLDVDMRVLLIVAAITVLTVLQIGLLPALDAGRADPLTILRGAEGAGRRTRDRAGIMIVGQIAMSLLLVGNAIAFIALLNRQLHAPAGFDAGRIVIASTASQNPHARIAEWNAAYDEAMGRVAAIPGIEGAAAAQGAPLFRTTWAAELSVPGRAPRADEQRATSLQAIGPGYFAAIGAPLVRGREFTPDDRTPAGGRSEEYDVVVVNEALARQLWQNADPLGQRLAIRGQSPATVVGVVRDMHDVSTVSFTPRAYFPLLESRFPSFEIVIRFSGEPSVMLRRTADAFVGVGTIQRPTLRTMATVRNDVLQVSRAASEELAACASIALVLTAIGLYGVVTMYAARRRKEIGIRMALGASAQSIYRMLTSEVVQLAAIGAGIGIPCAFVLVQVERTSLGPILTFGILPIVLSVGIMAAIVAVATFIPSRRAMAQTPADVLRE
jgi:predicted permease